ncbi:MAG: bifunctional precorrin-2 dehydrogenase/sirohydrochlorin ferrochelatase [Burkholderiales bacterium]|nr:bifunctional precorrin-2 dehydrogenase/sirohydrochlorin ferrochelatase [Anaerolineae bacterium]
MNYPVMLRLEGRSVVIVGGGKVAARKTPDLLNAGARVTIISPALNPALEMLNAQGVITWQATSYAPGQLTVVKPMLVFAATNSPAVNQQVAAEAESLGILVDVVDESAASDFSSMAALRRGPLTVAIATEGASPALTAHLRRKLDAMVGDEYTTLATWLAKLRPFVRANIASENERCALWQEIIDSPILDDLRSRDEDSARALLDSLLSNALSTNETHQQTSG